jgi:AAA domain
MTASPGASEQGLVVREFRELASLPPEPPWLWRGLLASGSLTLVAGQPFAGKSMLIGGLLRALALGEPFLGLETERASALLVSEEDDFTLRQRAELFGLLDLEGRYISRNSGALSRPWAELIEAATARAVAEGLRLLVVDTFPGLAQLQAEDENHAGAVGERLRPLQEATSHGLAVLVVHHANAAGQARGSSAFRGVVDVTVRFSRKDKVITLGTASRFAATPEVVRARLTWTRRPLTV